MSTAVPSQSNEVFWLALAMTPGLSAARVRSVVEHFGGVEAVFRASLTNLEGAGLRPASAQAIALGKSLESAQEELKQKRVVKGDRAFNNTAEHEESHRERRRQNRQAEQKQMKQQTADSDLVGFGRGFLRSRLREVFRRIVDDRRTIVFRPPVFI